MRRAQMYEYLYVMESTYPGPAPVVEPPQTVIRRRTKVVAEAVVARDCYVSALLMKEQSLPTLLAAMDIQWCVLDCWSMSAMRLNGRSQCSNRSARLERSGGPSGNEQGLGHAFSQSCPALFGRRCSFFRDSDRCTWKTFFSGPYDRQRDVLPLPLGALFDSVPQRTKLSRPVGRRLQKNNHVQALAHGVGTTINEMFCGCPDEGDSSHPPTAAQSESASRLLASAKAFGPPPQGLSGPGALEALRVTQSHSSESATIAPSLQPDAVAFSVFGAMSLR